MIRKLTLGFVALLTATNVSYAKNVEIAVPDSSEQLVVAIPDGWKKAWDHTEAEGVKTYTVEYVPEKQTVNNWDEMITVTVVRIDQPLMEGFHQKYAELTIKTFDNFCEARIAQPSIVTGTRNTFPVSVYKTDCWIKPEAKKALSPNIYLRNYELVNGLIVQGKDGIYQVQRAWHTDSMDAYPKAPSRAAIEELGKAEQTLQDFAVGGTTPCDVSASGKPCDPPPLSLR